MITVTAIQAAMEQFNQNISLPMVCAVKFTPQTKPALVEEGDNSLAHWTPPCTPLTVEFQVGLQIKALQTGQG